MNSIKEIALKANVSTGTVDRVLHNRPGVSKKTKEKILKIIKDSNYTVNTVASILASKKTFTIATLLPETKNSQEFWQTPKKGILKAFEEIKDLGFKIDSYEYDQFNAESYTSAFKKIAESKPNAVLLAPIFNKETKEYIHLLEEKEIPYIFINTEITELNNLSFVGQKSYQGGVVAAKLFNWVLPKDSSVLIIEIRKNITNYTAINHRIEGLKEYLKNTKKSITIQRITIDDIDDSEKLNHQLKKYLDLHTNIKGIFVPSSKINLIAQSILDMKRDDFELGGFDDTTENVAFLKKETIDFLIGQKPQQQGYDGIKILFNYLIHKKEPAKNYFLPIEILLKENVDFL